MTCHTWLKSDANSFWESVLEVWTLQSEKVHVFLVLWRTLENSGAVFLPDVSN